MIDTIAPRFRLLATNLSLFVTLTLIIVIRGSKLRMDKTNCHECSLPLDEVITRIIDTGIFINFRRNLRKYFLISRKHPQTARLIKSTHNVRNEEIYHLVKHYYMIHPFSLFNLHWTYVMTFIFWVYFIVIPFHLGLPLSKYGDTRWILLVCHIFHFIHIILCFFTGYHDKQNNLVIMNSSSVARRYLTSYFIPELLSLGPVILTDVRLYDYEPIWFFQSVPFLLYLKLVRVGTWLEYLKVVKHYSGIPDYVLTMFKVAMAFICTILWADGLFKFTKWRRWSKNYTAFLEDLEEITELILAVGLEKETESKYVAIITICFGFVFQLMIFVWIMHIWEKFSSVSTKHEKFYRELNAYMVYKALPVNKRKRINVFFHFKYQGNYYKEPTLRTLMSDRLKLEVMSTIAHNSVRKVDLFKNLPEDVLKKISKYLISETYLSGDLIIRAGTMGDAMYFILSGTVGVKMPDGTHVCFLKDGTNFGEISLILHIKRVATVEAITPCEILRLDRGYFIHAFKQCPGALTLLKNVANFRMANLGILSPILSQTKSIMDNETSYTNLNVTQHSKKATRSEEEILSSQLETDLPPKEADT